MATSTRTSGALSLGQDLHESSKQINDLNQNIDESSNIFIITGLVPGEDGSVMTGGG